MNLKNLAKYGKTSKIKEGIGSLDYGFIYEKHYIIVDKNTIEDVFDRLIDYWKERWAISRAERMPQWRNFNSNEIFEKIEKTLCFLTT